jgi:hypothetical protein
VAVAEHGAAQHLIKGERRVLKVPFPRFGWHGRLLGIGCRGQVYSIVGTMDCCSWNWSFTHAVARGWVRGGHVWCCILSGANDVPSLRLVESVLRYACVMRKRGLGRADAQLFVLSVYRYCYLCPMLITRSMYSGSVFVPNRLYIVLRPSLVFTTDWILHPSWNTCEPLLT